MIMNKKSIMHKQNRAMKKLHEQEDELYHCFTKNKNIKSREHKSKYRCQKNFINLQLQDIEALD